MTNLVLNPTAAAVQADAPCNSCGYNLRGLARDANCPECGTSVALSLRGDGLWFSSPRWVRELFAGALILFIQEVLHLMALAGHFYIRYADQDLEKWRWVMLTVSILCLTLSFIGTVLMTRREPRNSLASIHRFSARRLVRIVFAPYAVLSLFELSAALDETARSSTITWAIRMLIFGLGVVMSVSLLIVCRDLTQRMVRPGLSVLSWICTVIVVTAKGCILLAYALLLLELAPLTNASLVSNLVQIGSWLWLAELVVFVAFWLLLALALLSAARRAKRESQITVAVAASSFFPGLSRPQSNPA